MFLMVVYHLSGVMDVIDERWIRPFLPKTARTSLSSDENAYPKPQPHDKMHKVMLRNWRLEIYEFNG